MIFMWVLGVDVGFFCKILKQSQSLHYDFRSGLRFNGCVRPHADVLQSTSELRPIPECQSSPKGEPISRISDRDHLRNWVIGDPLTCILQNLTHTYSLMYTNLNLIVGFQMTGQGGQDPYQRHHPLEMNQGCKRVSSNMNHCHIPVLNHPGLP